MDVTSAVQADSPVTFVLSTSGSTNIRYSSRESATPPELVVETQVAGDCNSTGEHRGADDHRHAPAGANTGGDDGQLDRDRPDHLQLPVAALQSGLHRHQRCDRRSYTLLAADVGTTLRVAVTASNSAGNSHATSAQTATVTGSRDRARQYAPPTITGTAQQGQTADGDDGQLDRDRPDHLQLPVAALQAGPAAPTSTARPPAPTCSSAADVGTTLRVAVTASNSAGNSQATSTQTGAVTSIATRAREHGAADDQRHRPAGANADRDDGSWTRHRPDQLQLPVAALRPAGNTAPTSTAQPRQPTCSPAPTSARPSASPSPPATAPATAAQPQPKPPPCKQHPRRRGCVARGLRLRRATRM